jgi:DNA-binding transcriptional MerR regulator
MFPRDGYIRSEVEEMLDKEGFDASFEQLRKYEFYGLFEAQKAENKYRIYTTEVIEKIRRVFSLKLCGLSLRRIKDFLDMEKEILTNPLLNTMEAGIDSATGKKVLRKILPPRDTVSEKKLIEYDRYSQLINRYLMVCEEIKERAPKVQKILENARNDANHRESIVRDMLSHIKE